ncbi:MAG: radical SAM family heme chaperone HemW [Acidimicrobiia bacterium]
MSDERSSSIATSMAADDPALADAAHGWKSAYVHIPFCRRRCPYCDFAIVDESKDETNHKQYVDAVVAEIGLEEGIGALDAVNFGGGTPSTLAPSLLGTIVDVLRDRFSLVPDAEVSIEVNPEDWTDAYGDALAGAGVNRISIGAQSMDDSILGVLGRAHHASVIERVVAGARSSGMRSVSVDLILGHPQESEQSWESTVAATLELPIDHVSTYSLTVEPGTELSRMVNAGGEAPDDDVQADRYTHFEKASAAAGFARYEVSNHARAGHACRYNLSTWAHGEYVAFGMAAHDHRWGLRSRNHRRLDQYLAAVGAGVRPRLGHEELSEAEQKRDRLMLGLRLAAGTPLNDTASAFADTEAASRFVAAGVLEVAAGRLVVRDPLVADAVAREALSVSPFDC